MAVRRVLSLVLSALLASGCALLAPPAAKPAMPVAPLPPQHVVKGDPPVVPYKETVISGDGSLEKNCLAALKGMPQRLAWTWGDKLLTQTSSDGHIWRADYSTPRDVNPAHYNRIICSVMPNGSLDVQIAIDQPVDRLSIAAAELTAIASSTGSPK